MRMPGSPDFTYLGREEARRAIERDGLITAGDVGYLDEEGYLYLSDRRADIVISGGTNIYPAEIETVLSGMPGVRDSAVIGLPHEEFGEQLAAFVALGRREHAQPVRHKRGFAVSIQLGRKLL